MGTRRVAKKTTTKKRKTTAPKKTATKKTVTKVDTPRPDEVPNTNSKYAATYELFIEFMALPIAVRKNIFKDPNTGKRLRTQRDFARAYEIDEALLSRYKLKEEYVTKVSKVRRAYFKGEIGEAIQAVMNNIKAHGKGADLKVLLEYVNEIEKDDPLGETSQVYADLLAKISKMIPD